MTRGARGWPGPDDDPGRGGGEIAFRSRSRGRFLLLGWTFVQETRSTEGPPKLSAQAAPVEA